VYPAAGSILQMLKHPFIILIQMPIKFRIWETLK
jgi:hypothetical protein